MDTDIVSTITSHGPGRRQYQLDLTPAGQEFVCFLDQIHDEYAEKLKTGFQEEEWAQLEKLLKRMEEEA